MSLDGLLIIDKDAGMTSLDVVREIKAMFSIQKAGHIGTLDPFATGVLPIVINEATKLVPFLKEEPKEYEATMKIGMETTTDDLTGDLVRAEPFDDMSPQAIHSIFESFVGKIRQTPPMFSAVKVNGTPLYRMARKGIEIERKEREIEIYDLRLMEIALPFIRFRVSCSRGTYIRTLTKDIGRRIGCGAHLVSLRRLRSGPFTLEQSIPLTKVMTLAETESLSSCMIPMREALFHLPEVFGDERLIRKVRYGKEMTVRDLDPNSLPSFEEKQWLRMSSPEKGLVAILESAMRRGDIQKAAPGMVVLRPIRVFHASPSFR